MNRARYLPEFNALAAPSLVAPEITLTDRRWNDAYESAFHQAMTGAGSFWPRSGWAVATDAPRHDDEQHVRMFVALQTACAMPCASDGERWRVLMQALRKEADKYAQHVADERAGS